MLKKIISGVFAGEFILNKSTAREYKFLIFIFFLVLIYIGKNNLMEQTFIRERSNIKTLKNIKADYTSKASKLLELSKRGEIERLLKERNSNLQKSDIAPYVVLINQ